MDYQQVFWDTTLNIMSNVRQSQPFAVFDIDGTLIRWQLYHAVVGELAKRGELSAASYSQIRNARMRWKERASDEAFKDYERMLVKIYDQLLPNLDIAEFEAAVDAAFAEHKDQVYTYTRELIGSLQGRGYMIFAISNSHQEIVTKVADYYGFNDALGAIYERRDDHFTGKKDGYFTTKHLALALLIDKHQPNLKKSIAIGDSESDIDMLAMVERPIAFNPTKNLLAAARSHGWEVVIERKNVVYELKFKDGTYVLA